MAYMFLCISRRLISHQARHCSSSSRSSSIRGPKNYYPIKKTFKFAGQYIKNVEKSITRRSGSLLYSPISPISFHPPTTKPPPSYSGGTLHYAFIPRSDFNYIKVIAYLHFGIFCIISLGESAAKFGILSPSLPGLHCSVVRLVPTMNLCLHNIRTYIYACGIHA